MSSKVWQGLRRHLCTLLLPKGSTTQRVSLVMFMTIHYRQSASSTTQGCWPMLRRYLCISVASFIEE